MLRYPEPLIALRLLTAAAVLLAYITGGDPTKAKSALNA